MWWSGLAVLHPSLAWRRQTSKNQSFSRYFLSRAVFSSSARTIPWTLGELNFFYNGGGGGGGGCVRALVMDLQRYITARSVCSTCFIQARYSKAVTMSWTWGGGNYIYIYVQNSVLIFFLNTFFPFQFLWIPFFYFLDPFLMVKLNCINQKVFLND